MRARVCGALLALVPALASAEVRVTLHGGRLDLKAVATPLSEILDQLARQTGMKVVNDGPIPSMVLTVSLEDSTPVEAVFGVLQGLGLNYALVTDPTGMRVETLLISGAASPQRSEAPASSYRGSSGGHARQPTEPALDPGPLEPSAVGEEPEGANSSVEDSGATAMPVIETGAIQEQPLRQVHPPSFHPSTFTDPRTFRLPQPPVPTPIRP